MITLETEASGGVSLGESEIQYLREALETYVRNAKGDAPRAGFDCPHTFSCNTIAWAEEALKTLGT